MPSSPRPVLWRALAATLGCLAFGGLVAADDLPPPRRAAEKAVPYAPAPAPQQPSALLIDLITALKLVDAQSPTVAFAQARVAEAAARLDQASVLCLPNLLVGANYFRHDGIDQNRRGDVFSVSRNNIFLGGAAVLRLDVSDALFQPLVARQVADAVSADSVAVRNQVQLDAALAYMELLRVYAELAINADILERAEQILSRAKAADEAGIARTRADVNRAQTEVSIRRRERIAITGRIGAASARLVRVLNLQTNVDLRPADEVILPVALIPAACSLDDLVVTGLTSRPELAANRSLIGASSQRLRQARLEPLIPAVQLEYRGGEYTGARNGNYSDLGFQSQGELAAGAYWQLRNLGFGYHAQVKTRQAELEQTQLRGVELEAQVRAEVVDAAKLAAAAFASLDEAQQAVREALEMYRKLSDTSFGMIGPRRQYDAIEPLLAIQALNQARNQYLSEVIGFNRAQFRLYAAIGQPALCSLPTAQPQPVQVPVIPPPGSAAAASPTRKDKPKE